MKYIKSIFKISIILLLLIVCIGSISASDSTDEIIDDDDSDLDDDLDDFDDEDDDSDDDLDDEDDVDVNESDYQFDEYEYLKNKITVYLTKYGNASDENWTDSEQFIEEYNIYLSNPSNYTLNKSSQGYETYLKIFDSITSTFNNYNLTQNQTDFLKFMIIYYLNHYGNVSANYTWNESDDFSKFELPLMYALSSIYSGSASAPDTYVPYSYSNLNNIFSKTLNNSTDTNTTNNTNGVVVNNSFEWNDILLIILVIILLVFVII